jgi:hypothetical protein
MTSHPFGPGTPVLNLDTDRFLTDWGRQAYALGWTLRELFGPSGLVSHLAGRPVIVLTATEAIIQEGDRRSLYRRPRRFSKDHSSLDKALNEALGKILPFVSIKEPSDERR